MTPVRTNLSLRMFQSAMVAEDKMISRTPKDMVWMFVRTLTYNSLQRAVVEKVR